MARQPAFAVGLLLMLTGLSYAQDVEHLRRLRMIDEIAAMARMTASETGRAAFAPRVMEAMARVPRHRFVPIEQIASAYDNRPLPIGSGQTISQPFIVALMTDLIAPRPEHSVLEVGTGSGYQAAILAELVARVSTIEIVEPLGLRAAETLRGLGYRNVTTRIGDGYLGWPERAPFDAIIVTAAAPGVPPALVDQLKPAGRMVIPVGGTGQIQQLLLIEKSPDGRTTERRVLPVRFVPLTRGTPRQ